DFHFFTAVTADITPKTLTITGIQINNKTYDGSTGATIAPSSGGQISGLVSGDDVSIDQIGTAIGAEAAFVDKDAGTGKAVTVTGVLPTGADAGTYTIASATGTADITKATLTVSGITASKVYDGTTAATLNTDSVSFSGPVGGDSVTLDLSMVDA